MKPRIPVFLVAAAFVVPTTLPAAEPAALHPGMSAFLEKYCISCHGPDKQKADFRVDELRVSQDEVDAEYWQLVLDNLHLGDMPPEDEPQPTIAELEPVTTWIESELERARRELGGHGSEVVLRRLNRFEYENAMLDLFGVRGDFALGFPEDAKAEGFDNIGAALMLSSAQLEEYVRAAGQVIDLSVVQGAKPKLVSIKTTLRELQEKENRAEAEKAAKRTKDSGYTPTPAEKKREAEARKRGDSGTPFFPLDDASGHAQLLTGYLKLNTARFAPVRDAGWYRFKFNAIPLRAADKTLKLRVTYGSSRPDEQHEVAGLAYLNGSKPQDFEYRVYLERGDQILVHFVNGTPFLRGPKLEAEKNNHPGVAIPNIEFEGPIVDQWPPKGHQLLLGDRMPKDLKDADVPALLENLAPKLFRRPVESSVLAEFRSFYDASRKNGLAEFDAYKLTVQAMMASPHFIYHVESPPSKAGTIDDHALANRLAFFLWRSVPDDELYALAAAGKLTREPAQLSVQVDRMLKDPKAARFIDDFVGKWLEVERVGEMPPDANLYPEFDDDLERALPRETIEFVREMIVNDLPIRNLLDSDWTMLNQRLAEHYGIPGVKGDAFRKVALDKSQTIRGGVLTQAAIHNITSNGTTTSPVIRGVWLLDRVLGTPAPPPPPDVPPIEPDIRGATTIKDQLEKHRNIAQCASCHQKIDPYGLALENFDVIGGWRDHYRALEDQPRGKPKLTDGQPVISTDKLPRLGVYDDFQKFRSLLVKESHLVERNVAEKLSIYALGRKMTFADETDIDAMVRAARTRDGGMRTMIHAVVRSPLFLRP